MIRRLGWMVTLVALVAAGAAQMAHARPKAPRGFYGITSQTLLKQADFRALGDGGVGTLRIEFPWGDADLLPPPADDPAAIFTPRPYRWSIIDPNVRKAAKQGIRILPTVYGMPHWVANRYQQCPRECYKLGPSSIGAYIAFAQFMRAAVERYGPNGTFWELYPRIPYKPIRTWQIWNEQNSSDFWKPFPSVENYGNMVVAGSAAVKAVDPRAQVVLGGMLLEPGEPGKATISGWSFLSSLYDDPEARAAFDGIGVHPYGASLRSVRGTIGRWRDELREAGTIRRDRLFVTELGWATGGPPHALNVGARKQASLLRQTLRYFTEQRKRLNIAQVVVYSWRDAPPGADNCSWCVKSGLVRHNRRKPKPAWDVFRRFTGAFPR